MQTSLLKSHKSMRTAYIVVFFAMAAGIPPAAAEDIPARLEKAVAVLNTLTDSSGHGISPQEIASTDCVAVIRGFKKGAAVVGVGYGRGFISCREGDNWSAPGAVTLERGSVVFFAMAAGIPPAAASLDKQRRSKLLSDRFAIGSAASAVWGNGKSAHGDSNAKILFFGHTTRAFADFDLDGATLKPDDSRKKVLYGKVTQNIEIVEGGAATPAVAQPLVSKLTSLLRPESATQ
jgi:lipid-binding SYLF domain-containing protein